MTAGVNKISGQRQLFSTRAAWGLAGHAGLEIPFWPMVLTAVKLVVFPVFAGFAVRQYFKERLEKVLARDHIGPRGAIPAAMFVFMCIITASLLAEAWQKGRAGAGDRACDGA